MSSDQMTTRARQTLKSLREILEKAEESAHVALKRAAPAVQKSVDASMEAASKGFSATMKSIDGATSKEQAELLRAYRKVLAAQVDLVDSRLVSMESKTRQRSRPGPERTDP
ncbi:MAG: hypothetical protein JRN57_02670 [Nitrososphaerota archaeon]|nr:hypothetical protein [Nitrososphaerota archaeon]MDG7011004.1 hypothetical protein [Nitrososphaerota archaeon]